MNESSSSPPHDSWENEATRPAPSGGSFFTFWRCCGCLAVLGLVAAIAAGIGIKLAIDATFQTTPLEMPESAFSEAEVEEIEARLGPAFDAGEIVELTPEELTILVNNKLADPSSNSGPESRFYCGATPDGLLDLKICLQVPEMPDVPWYMPTGRFFNLELVGLIEIKDGEVTEAQLDSLKLGGWPVQEGSTEEQSTSWLEMIQDETTVDPEMRDAISRLELFQFDGEKLRLRVSGNGSSGGGPAPVESPETPEAPDAPTPEEPTQPKGG